MSRQQGEVQPQQSNVVTNNTIPISLTTFGLIDDEEFIWNLYVQLERGLINVSRANNNEWEHLFDSTRPINLIKLFERSCPEKEKIGELCELLFLMRFGKGCCAIEQAFIVEALLSTIKIGVFVNEATKDPFDHHQMLLARISGFLANQPTKDFSKENIHTIREKLLKIMTKDIGRAESYVHKILVMASSNDPRIGALLFNEYRDRYNLLQRSYDLQILSKNIVENIDRCHSNNGLFQEIKIAIEKCFKTDRIAQLALYFVKHGGSIDVFLGTQISADKNATPSARQCYEEFLCCVEYDEEKIKKFFTKTRLQISANNTSVTPLPLVAQSAYKEEVPYTPGFWGTPTGTKLDQCYRDGAEKIGAEKTILEDIGERALVDGVQVRF